MPTVACPGCQKRYELPASAAGQVATCKACGKRFRIGGAPAPPVPKPTNVVESAASDNGEDFWDEALSEEYTVQPPEDSPASAAVSDSPGMEYLRKAEQQLAEDGETKKKRWGFQWEKVVGGVATFVIAGGVTVALVVATDRLFFLPAIVSLGGLVTALSGLMGDEGIW